MSDWDALARHFEALSALDPTARERRLREIGGREPQLAEELRGLLAAGEATSGPVERLAAAAPRTVEPQADLSGTQVGPYALGDQIGEGGMGVVYRARRTDESFDKEVAVKFLSGGLWQQTRLDAFLRERRILASLDHPNIARLIDAGRLESVGPYVIMELVQGEPVDRYCERLGLPVEARLRLFRKVCMAVQAAHRQLIVHRDLKPSNILVTPEGEPKLLDFGIAKLLDDDRAEETQTRAMTPEFASPEQIRGEGVSTATDVYALGLTLYRLLAGRSARGDSADSSPYERQQAVLREDAAPLSGAAADAGRPPDFVRKLRGDVENIVAKALSRDPEQRYGMAAELADDLERHLEGLPVVARAATARYRLGKFLRRNALAVTVTAGVIVALAAASAIAYNQARIAEQARLEAERRNASMQQLTETLLFDFYQELQQVPGTVPLRAQLVGHASEYLLQLRERAVDDPALAASLVNTYARIGDLRGNPSDDNQGDVAGARESYEQGISFCREVEQMTRGNAPLTVACLRMQRRVAFMDYTAGKLDDSIDLATEALAGAEGALEAFPDHDPLRIEQADLIALLAEVLTWNSRSDDGIARFEEAIEIYRELAGRDLSPKNKRYVERSIASALTLLASEHVFYKRFDQGMPMHREAVAYARTSLEEDPDSRELRRNLWYQLVWYTNSMIDDPADHPSLVDTARKTLEMARTMRAAEPNNDISRSDLSTSVRYFARAMVKTGDYRNAIPAFEEAATLYAAAPAETRAERRVALVLQGKAEAHEALGEKREACGGYAQALAIWRDLEQSGRIQPADSDWPRLVTEKRTKAGCS